MSVTHSFLMLKKYFARREFLKRLKGLRALRSLETKEDVEDRYLDSIELFSSMVEKPLGLPKSASFGLVPEEYTDVLDILVRQKLMHLNYGPRMLPGAMMNASQPATKFTFALPKIWRRYLQKQGMPVCELKSSIAFFVDQLRQWYFGLRRIWRCLYDSANNPIVDNKPYTVMVDFPAASIIGQNSDIPDKACFVPWYRNKNGLEANGHQLWISLLDKNSQIPPEYVTFIKGPFPAFENWFCRGRVVLRIIGILVMTFVRWGQGAWWAPYLLADAVDLAYCREIKSDQFPTTILFNNTNWFFRPLWSYLYEKAGAEIIMVFYSTNVESYLFKNKRTDPTQPTYKLINWPHYYVWHKKQAKFILKNCINKSANIEIVGPVPLADYDVCTPAFPDNAVAVFDVSIRRPWYLAMLGLRHYYYTEDMVVKFLKQSYQAITEMGGFMVLKPKKINKKIFAKSYLALLEELSQKENFMLVDSNISAFRIIDQIKTVISLPFTSTAFIARDMKKNSAFFDPTMELQDGNPGADTVVMLSGANELDNWLRMISDNRQDIKDHV